MPATSQCVIPSVFPPFTFSESAARTTRVNFFSYSIIMSTSHQCSKCHRPLRGHARPWGENCQLTELGDITCAVSTTVTTTTLSVSSVSLLTSTVTSASTASGLSSTLTPTESTHDRQDTSSVEELQAELTALEDEGRELQKRLEVQQLQEKISRRRAANAELQQQYYVPDTTVTSADTSSANFPTSAQLRGLGSLNDEVNRIIYGSPATAAIADPVNVSQPTQASRPYVPGTFRISGNPSLFTDPSVQPSGNAVCGGQMFPNSPVMATHEYPSAAVPFAPGTEKIKGKPILLPSDFVHRSGLSNVPFDKLSLPEVVIGTLRIVLLPDTPSLERRARLEQLIDAMIYAEQFKWPKVRSVLEEGLFQIGQGRRQWSQSLRDLQPEMLKAWDLLDRPTNTPAIPRPNNSQICNQWNYRQDGCPRGNGCPYRHICRECFMSQGRDDSRHRAKQCPNTPQRPCDTPCDPMPGPPYTTGPHRRQ